jgi:hypothetical protein
LESVDDLPLPVGKIDLDKMGVPRKMVAVVTPAAHAPRFANIVALIPFGVLPVGCANAASGRPFGSRSFNDC